MAREIAKTEGVVMPFGSGLVRRPNFKGEINSLSWELTWKFIVQVIILGGEAPQSDVACNGCSRFLNLWNRFGKLGGLFRSQVN